MLYADKRYTSKIGKTGEYIGYYIAISYGISTMVDKAEFNHLKIAYGEAGLIKPNLLALWFAKNFQEIKDSYSTDIRKG